MSERAGITVEGQLIAEHAPWPRLVVGAAEWARLADELNRGNCTLLGLWGEPAAAHMALAWNDRIAVLTILCPDQRYPSVSPLHPPAVRLERAMADLFGLQPVGLPDPRPWLDHGRWGVHAPLGPCTTRTQPATAYAFLPAEGEQIHQVAVGPVHAGIIEPGHFRFNCDGETIVRLEERLGYTHKGLEALLQGADVAQGARLAGRASGDSTVAYALAFARAAEAALRIDVPARAVWLRALMAELERLANHLGDVGAVCNDAAFSLMHAHCAILRERVLRTAGGCFGHRLMMDCIVPGGIAVDLGADGVANIHLLVSEVRRQFAPLVELYDNTASLQDRTVGAGVVRPELARQFGCGGFVGRAAGRAWDARQSLGYPPYDSLEFDVPVRSEGDVNARVWIRIEEIAQSLSLVDQILNDLPDGPASAGFDTGYKSGPLEGMAIVEGFRGDILVWLRIGSSGRIDRCHLRDPSWFQWPLLEAAIEGNIIADLPLCNKSFNCSYSGHDL